MSTIKHIFVVTALCLAGTTLQSQPRKTDRSCRAQLLLDQFKLLMEQEFLKPGSFLWYKLKVEIEWYDTLIREKS